MRWTLKPWSGLRGRKTSLMLLCFPQPGGGSDPGGAHAPDGICRGNDVVIVADEIHGDLVPKGRHICFATLSQEAARNCILCTAPSKTFNIPGLQTSNIFILNPEIRERVARQARLDGCCGLSWFGRAATIAAYREGEAWLEACLRVVASNLWDITDISGAAARGKAVPHGGDLPGLGRLRALGMEEKELESSCGSGPICSPTRGTALGKRAPASSASTWPCPRKPSGDSWTCCWRPGDPL